MVSGKKDAFKDDPKLVRKLLIIVKTTRWQSSMDDYGVVGGMVAMYCGLMVGVVSAIGGTPNVCLERNAALDRGNTSTNILNWVAAAKSWRWSSSR